MSRQTIRVELSPLTIIYRLGFSLPPVGHPPVDPSPLDLSEMAGYSPRARRLITVAGQVHEIRSGENVHHHFSVNIRQSQFSASESIFQPLVIEAQQMKDSGMQIMN